MTEIEIGDSPLLRFGVWAEMQADWGFGNPVAGAAGLRVASSAEVTSNRFTCSST